MSHTLNSLLRIYRSKGLIGTGKDVIQYLYHYPLSLIRLVLKPRFARPEDLRDFIFYSMGGLYTPMQIESEFIQLVTLLRKRRPSTVLEIGTARG